MCLYVCHVVSLSVCLHVWYINILHERFITVLLSQIVLIVNIYLSLKEKNVKEQAQVQDLHV